MKGLKELIGEKLLIAPGAFNAISAKIIEQAGFKAVYLSGAGMINSMAALPDIGLLSMTEVRDAARHVVNSVKIPVIVDIDTGFGDLHNLARTIKEFRDIGVGAVQIEDQTFPKRCGHLSGKSLISKDEMQEKISTAKNASGDMLVIARTDARGVTGLEDAIERADAYAKAGADIIFPEALISEEEFITFRKEIKKPLFANMTEFGKTPIISGKRFAEIGIDILIYPMTAFRIMAKAIKDAMTTLKTEETQLGLLERMMTREELYELIEYDKFDKNNS